MMQSPMCSCEAWPWASSINKAGAPWAQEGPEKALLYLLELCGRVEMTYLPEVTSTEQAEPGLCLRAPAPYFPSLWGKK